MPRHCSLVTSGKRVSKNWLPPYSSQDEESHRSTIGIMMNHRLLDSPQTSLRVKDDVLFSNKSAIWPVCIQLRAKIHLTAFAGS